MKAVQYQRPGKIELIEMLLPEPAAGEVLIKVACAGICGTDIHIMAEESPAAAQVVLGHEFSGTIAAAGATVEGFQPGEAVAVDPNNYCGKCHYCRRGQVHFCENLTPVGVFRDGAWAEYCLVPTDQVYRLLPDVPLEWGALGEPLSCILHGWDRLQALEHSNNILILGGGIIGILWGLLLKNYRYDNFTFSEPLPNRRDILHSLNFPAAAPEEIVSRNVRQKTGFDVIIDCSGNPKAIEESYELINPLGKMLFFGVCPMESKMRIAPFWLFKKELTLIGSVINPFTFSRAIALLSEIHCPLENLGVKMFSLTDFRKAIAAVKSGEVTKGIFRVG